MQPQQKEFLTVREFVVTLQTADRAIPATAAAKAALASEVVREFGKIQCRVSGGSMLPSLWPGDQLTVERHSFAEVLPGDLVQFRHSNLLVAHRVVRHEGHRLITRGDSVAAEDLPVYEETFVGKVGAVVRKGRAVDPRLTPLQQLAAWFLRRSELLVRVALRAGRTEW
jgi:Peptidase S24-like